MLLPKKLSPRLYWMKLIQNSSYGTGIHYVAKVGRKTNMIHYGVVLYTDKITVHPVHVERNQQDSDCCHLVEDAWEDQAA